MWKIVEALAAANWSNVHSVWFWFKEQQAASGWWGVLKTSDVTVVKQSKWEAEDEVEQWRQDSKTQTETKASYVTAVAALHVSTVITGARLCYIEQQDDTAASREVTSLAKTTVCSQVILYLSH